MKPWRLWPVAVVSLLAVLSASAQVRKLAAAEAKNHVGERATVCGKVVSSRYAGGSKGEPTFLNLDEPFPKQIFTIVIWGHDRRKFGEPEHKYSDKQICATGRITSYRGSPEIVATDVKEIEIQK